MSKLQLERFTVRGTPRQMGRAQGEHWRTRIRAFIDMRFTSVDKYARDRGRASAEGIRPAGAASMAIYGAWDPAGFEEHSGIAEAAGVDPLELFTASNMTDLRDVVLLGAPAAEREGCSALLVPASHTADGSPLGGQTWDLNPPDVAYIVAVRRVPDEGPQTWAVTCTGCLTLMGVNERGLAVGTTNVKTHGARPGVGYLGLLHRMLTACGSAAEAEAVLRDAPRAGAHTYWLADPQRQVEWEASATHAFARSAAEGPIWRTNHCLAPTHVAIQGEPPSESSLARFARLGALLDRPDNDLDTVRAALADRSDGVLSLNRYEADEQGTATNAVFIASPARREAHACRGPADRGEWVRLAFD